MKKITAFVALGLAALTAVAQEQQPNSTQEMKGIKLVGYDNPKTFLDAKLELVPMLVAGKEKEMLDTGNITFQFKVFNYKLGVQTPDAETQQCANSAKGQHIHFILDNQPYQASYSPDIVARLKPGHHVLLAFLSRSYHESIKSHSAYVLKEFDVMKKTPDQFDKHLPHLFFSRPKADYVGEKETKRVLLDFYLVNCTLSEKGYTVRLTIDGGATFIITKWEPYYIEGLGLGQHKIKLELLDKNGKLVQSGYNGTERTIKLLSEPAAK